MEQIIKLTGRIAEVLPASGGVSQRTGNPWMSQSYIFEYFMWSGQQNPTKLCVKVFGEDNIKRHNLKALEENVTLTQENYKEVDADICRERDQAARWWKIFQSEKCRVKSGKFASARRFFS
jgi:hypothetical protein